MLRDEIVGGKYGATSAFPGSTALARRFKTSRATIRRALDELHHQGLVDSRQGRVTFVTRTGRERKIGLIMPGLATSEFFQPLATTLIRLAQEHDYELQFGDVYPRDPTRRVQAAKDLAADFIRRRVSGIIYQPLEYAFDKGNTNRRDARIALVASERSVTAFPSHRHALVETGYRRQDYKADGTVWTRPQLKAPFDGEMCNGAQERFSRCGSTYDLLMAEDLKDNPGDYPLYVFYNLFKYDEATLAAVEKLRARGATLVWIYAPGWFNGNSLEPMRRLTGMAFKETSGGRPVVAMKEDGRLMGQVGATVARRFSPTDADEVLGTYENGEPGLAVKRVGGSRAVFSGAWQLDIAFMRRLAQYAKAHVYVNTDDPVDADESLFTLHARWPGRKTVRLPRKAEAVVDVFGKRIVARNADVFTFDAELHSTHLFYFGEDGDRLLAELKKGDVGLQRQVFPEGSLSLFRNVIESTSKRKE